MTSAWHRSHEKRCSMAVSASLPSEANHFIAPPHFGQERVTYGGTLSFVIRAPAEFL